jgi:Protein of unknown function (DUF2924)
MPIEDRNLQAGTVLVGRHKGTEHRCEVVETPEGVRYQVDRGEIFRSPSSPAQHVTGGAVNGWVFWSVGDSEKSKRERKAKAAPRQPPTAKKPTKASKKGKTKKGKAMRAASKRASPHTATTPASRRSGA